MPEKPQRLKATALRVISAYCLERAVIATDPKAFRAALRQAGGDEDIKTKVEVETVGIAFSQKPDAILSPAQIPQRDEIAAELGFYNRLQFGEGYRRFVWIGFFQIHNNAYGLIHEFGYEGSGIDLIEITNNKGRILTRLYEGGC